MSAAAADYVLNEMDFPNLTEKPSAERRVNTAKAGKKNQHLQKEGIVTKELIDPKNVLGKRRKQRLLSECNDEMECGVPYSLNRKNRWEADAVALLRDAACDADVQVDVVEAYIAGRRAEKLAVKALHSLNEDGSVSSRIAGGTASSVKSLRAEQKRERKSSSHAESEDEEEQVVAEKPQLQYTIMTANPSKRAVKNKSKESRRTGRRAGAFRVDPADTEPLSEMENSIHVEDADTYKPSRDFRFCLADYMKKPAVKTSSAEEGEERERTPELINDEELEMIDPSIRPFALLDISACLRTPHEMLTVTIATGRWNGFSFSQQIDSLLSHPRLTVRWLDANHRRASVDVTRMLLGERDSFDCSELFIVFERVSRTQLRMTINSSRLSGQTPCQLKKTLDKAVLESRKLREVIEKIACAAVQWERVSASSSPSLFDARREEFQPERCSARLARPATLINQLRMADILREESLEFAPEQFERIDEDSFSSDEEAEEWDGCGGDIKAKCASCPCSDASVLYELDECWKCESCLRSLVLREIKARRLPLELPLVCAEGSAPVDTLPALLPLPLVTFYCKTAATEVLCVSTVEIGDLADCPQCKQTVHVQRPNEFRSAQCTGCNVMWCVECGAAPHWPMDCKQNEQWNDKFSKQYLTDLMKDEIDQHIKRITCTCGQIIECGDKATQAECTNCCLEFNPSTMIMNRTSFPYNAAMRKFVKKYKEHGDGELAFPAASVELIVPARLIAKQFSEPASEARFNRFNEAKTLEFEKKARKLREVAPNADKLKELRKTALVLLECGTGWLYMQRGEGQTEPRQALKALARCLIECEAVADQQPREGASAKIDALDSAITKVIDVIRKAL